MTNVKSIMGNNWHILKRASINPPTTSRLKAWAVFPCKVCSRLPLIA